MTTDVTEEIASDLQDLQAELDTATWDGAAAEWSDAPTVPEARATMSDLVWGPAACAAVDAVDAAWTVQS